MSANETPNPYRVLAIGKSATIADIDVAYARAFKAARRGEGVWTAEQVNGAREALRDPDARLLCDIETPNVPLDDALAADLRGFDGVFAPVFEPLRVEPDDLWPHLPPFPADALERMSRSLAERMPVPDEGEVRRAVCRIVLEMLDPWPERKVP